MDKAVQLKLAELLARDNGHYTARDLCTDQALLASLFHDHCPLQERETSLLVTLVELGAARELLEWNETSGPVDVVVDRWVDALGRRRAIEAPAARWGLLCWAVGLKKMRVEEMDRILGGGPAAAPPAKPAPLPPAKAQVEAPAKPAVVVPPQPAPKKADPAPGTGAKRWIVVGQVVIGCVIAVVALWLGAIVAQWLSGALGVSLPVAIFILIAVGRLLAWLGKK